LGAVASYLFESSWKKRYSDRGVRRLLERYATAAGLPQPISPHRLRHCLLTWLKKQGVDDALIRPYSGVPFDNRSRSTHDLRLPMLRQHTPTPWVDSRCRPLGPLLCGW
jgi:integrase